MNSNARRFAKISFYLALFVLLMPAFYYLGDVVGCSHDDAPWGKCGFVWLFLWLPYVLSTFPVSIAFTFCIFATPALMIREYMRTKTFDKVTCFYFVPVFLLFVTGVYLNVTFHGEHTGYDLNGALRMLSVIGNPLGKLF